MLRWVWLGAAAAVIAATANSQRGAFDGMNTVSPNQLFKNPRIEEIVRPEHDNGTNPLGVSDNEWRSRVEAAAAARALALHGFNDLAAQCIMVRVKGETDMMITGEWGVFFSEITASNGLVKVAFDGHMIDNGSRVLATSSHVNMGCLPVAIPIFRERPDVNVILHTHPHAVMAVGGLKAGLLPLSQAAFMFHNVVTRYKYDFAYGSEFETKMQEGFRGNIRAMLLDHHGMYTVGHDVASAFFVTYHINQACEVQIKTLSAVNSMGELNIPSDEVLEAQYKEMMASTDYAYDGSREWPGIVRALKKAAPEFNT